MRAVVALLALAALASQSGSQAQGRSEPFVPIGVWYGGGTASPPIAPRNPAPEREAWRRDLQTIRELGFNSVRTWVDWAGAEPIRGTYRFDALDQLLDLADDAKLRVVVQVYTEAVPDWVGRDFPDANFVSADGITPGSRPLPGYCLDHPGVRKLAAAFIGAAAARAARHASFHAIDVWSDPPIVRGVVFDRPQRFCYCPHTRRRFREWLQSKYATVESLNQAWSRTFGGWAEAEPPRFDSTLSYTDLIDWKLFEATRLRDDLKWKADASSPRSGRPVVAHSASPGVTSGPLSSVDGSDDWLMTTAVDYFGTSLQPRPVDDPDASSAVTLSAGLDAIRSATQQRGWWAAAIQAGQAMRAAHAGPFVTADDVRLWGWAALSRGAIGLGYSTWYPTSVGHAAGSSGLIDLDGRVTDRARAAGAFASIVARNAALFAPLRPRVPQAGILYNRLSYLAGGGGRQTTEAVRDSTLGFYRAMHERNIPVDFIHADQAAAGGTQAYQIIFLPHPLMLSRAVTDALTAFVQRGGTLVSEARPAWSDEQGRASARVPGGGLDEVFGVREKLVRPRDDAEMIAAQTLDGPLAVLSGRPIVAGGLEEHLEITGSNVSVIARFRGENGATGDPAVTLARHGSGRAILLGSFPGRAFQREPQRARTNGELFGAFAELAGVSPEVRIDGGGGAVEMRRLESSAATVFIGINHSDRPQTVTFAFGPDVPEAIWLNMETGASVNFVAGRSGPTYTYSFKPRDVLVLMIKNELR